MTQAGRIPDAAPGWHLVCNGDLGVEQDGSGASFRARRPRSPARRIGLPAAPGRPRGCGCLTVFDRPADRRTAAAADRGLREIPLDAIRGTLEPNRAAQFDADFRPAASIRARWQSIWLAERSGAVLPPISVVQVGDEYAIRDGHHRVSVARARGACTISAFVNMATA